MTLSDLAKLANVSVSVASKAFSGKGEISSAMRDHVFEVAKAHGCFHQFYNVPYDRPVVAVIIPEAISEYYIDYVECLKRGFEENNVTMLLSISNFDRDMERELVRYYTEHGKINALLSVDGTVEFPRKVDDILFVKLGQATPTADISVTTTDQKGMNDTVKALIDAGHTRIAFAGEPLTVGKADMLRHAMEIYGLGLRDEYATCSDYRFERAGEDRAEYLMSLPIPPTAIIGSYGRVTRGVIFGLRRLGYSIPEDVSVVSLDNVPSPLDLELDVAYIDPEIEQRCSVTVQRVCEKLGCKKTDEIICVERSFHFGNSIGKAK
jgi:DNA-binding LacI/PurR family transcriptional regulator